MKATMTRVEFAKYVGISVRKLDQLLAERQVACARIGGRVLFTTKHAEELLEKFDQKAIKPRALRVVNS